MLSTIVKNILAKNRFGLATLEGNLRSMNKGEPVRSILVTSSSPGEGKSVCAASFAHVLASSNSGKVLLIEGNFHFPEVHNLFDVEIEPGLTDYLTSECGKDTACKKTEVENLYVMPLGQKISNPLDFLGSEVFVEKLRSLTDEFNYILFDGGAVLSSSEPTLVARHFDGVIVVVECEKTKLPVLDLAQTRLSSVDGNVMGVILNKRRFYVPRFLYRFI